MDDAIAHLDRMFKPKSIALVGAKDRSVWSVSAFDNLKRAGFRGKVHLINPKGGVIHGCEAHTSCAAVGEKIDAALLMVPESVLLDTFEDLHAAGVEAAVILSSGFAEAGAEGASKQRAMTEKARSLGIRLLGPNCLGFANYLDSTTIWSTPLRGPAPNPAVAIVSQSGALAAQLAQFAHQQRVSLTHMISTGNEADVSVAEVIEYLSAQPEPKAIALFLESVRDPEGFIKAAAAANRAGKKIVVLKVGSSEAAAKAAQAHTGSLVGDDAVFNALCKKLGIVRVHSLEQLIVTTDLFASFSDKTVKSKGLALMAMSGGLCEIAVDQAEEIGLNIPQLQPETKAALADALPTFATPNNPLDLTGGAMVDPSLISTAIRIISQDPNVGAVGFVFDVPATNDKRNFAKNFIAEVAAGFKAIEIPGLMLSHTFSAVSSEGRGMTDEFGMVYSGGGVNHVLTAMTDILASDAASVDVLSGSTGAATSARPNSERAVLDYLASHGAAVIPAHVVTSAEQAATAAETLAGPVVLKILSEDIQHKTEVGGVALNIAGPEAAAKAYEEIMASVTSKAPSAKIEGVIVSPMRGKGVELFVGTMRDPQWGPAITLGLGGIWVEALKDTSLRLLPVSRDEVKEMVSELRGAVLLDGFRGAAKVDLDALADTVVAIGNAALALGPELVSLEVNPILASDHGIEALDGLAVWE